MTMTSTSLPSSSRSESIATARVRWTGRSEGDLGLTAGEGVDGRRAAVQPGPWAWLTQVHGADVHVVERPGAVQGRPGDALVSVVPGVVLAVFTADCAPVALGSPEGVFGVAHAGWRGIETGVIEATIGVMRDLGATRIEAALGPCIRPECYEFGADDLDRLRAVLGPAVVGRTAEGHPALDVPAAVRMCLERAGVALTTDHGACTACSADFYSYRARGDRARQATVVTG
jgi:polyphenol oxidase